MGGWIRAPVPRVVFCWVVFWFRWASGVEAFRVSFLFLSSFFAMTGMPYFSFR